MYRYAGHALLLVLGAIFVFHSPFARWWAEQGLPWYTVFVLWFVLIALVAIDNIMGDKSLDDNSNPIDEPGQSGTHPPTSIKRANPSSESDAE